MCDYYVPVNPANGLRVMTRIPGRIKHDHPVSSNKIDSQRSCPRRDEENEDIWVAIEFVYEFLSL